MGRGYWGWDSDFYPPPPPKLPPPEHGIKVKKFGSTWWGQRWIQALDRFGGEYSARLGRGRSYARQGRVHDLTVKDGVVTARVTGSRPTPYKVTIRLAALGARVWEKAIKEMAGRAVFAARLLSGEMPREIDEAFQACRASLFPETKKDLVTACTCPDWANPCKHVAAVHYVLGEAFDRDPFLLFELRGRTKEKVLAALRRLRSASGTAERTHAGKQASAPAASASQRMTPDRYEVFRESVDDLSFHIGAPAVEGSLLRQLGAPLSWQLSQTPRALLQPAVSRAAALARELALGAATDESNSEAPASSPPSTRKRSPKKVTPARRRK
ncbi:MAG: SWIM zinc finger family protein [Candidatus Tectomicrobia bacterium]|uniref:SWIM zinc finger family protein n=1 Tax=Tectimicrobiota bacterium TaxID=2528274 RepID=A0A932GP30_UNCTE|nr:SWIM zinc finger family protein [Candidatus Tectomicrobia bacterium]